jgi:hypothetical protein
MPRAVGTAANTHHLDRRTERNVSQTPNTAIANRPNHAAREPDMTSAIAEMKQAAP